MQYLTAIDLTNNEIKNVIIDNLAAAPSSPAAGRIYFDTTLGHARVYSGTAWTDVTDAWISDVQGTAPVVASVTGGIATVSINAATTSTAGSMSATDKTKLDNATNLSTGSTLVFRDSSGNFSAGTITADLAGNAATATNASQLGGQAGSYYLARANHTGTQLASTISDLHTVVVAYRLDEFAAPTSNVSMNANKIINVADPTAAQDAATKNYVDNMSAGLDFKESVRVATTANITLTSPGTTIDGVTLATNDRVLVKNQTAGADNGIYIFNGSTSAMTRSADANSNADVTSGMFVFVSEGTTNGTTSWVLSTTDPITVGTTALGFTQFSGGGTYIGGAGLTLTGTTFNVGAGNGISVNADTVQISSTYAGQTSITTVGTISNGTWHGTTIGVAYGGTGATNATGARANLGATGKFSATVGDNSATSYVLNHNLNTQDVVVLLRQTASPYAQVMADVELTTVNSATIKFNTAPAVAEYKAIIVG